MGTATQGKNPNVSILLDPEIPTEILAKAIVEVADAAKKLLAGPLTKRAIVLLIHDYLGGTVGKRQIEDVLKSASSLRWYIDHDKLKG